jgi:outer membrane biosynthesis protein TonB
MLDKKDKKVTTRFAAVPSALGAVLVIGAVALGGTVVRPMSDQVGHSPNEKPAQVEVEKEKPATDKPAKEKPADSKPADKEHDPALKHREKPVKHEPAKDPKPETAPEQKEQPKEEPKPAPKPQPKETAKPKPAPKETVKPKPVSTTLDLWTGMHDGKLKVAWSAYEGDGFSYYKLVRSTDAAAAWPTGAGDELVAAVSDRWATKVKDGGAPCDTEVYYRVFAVKATDHGYQVLASSPVRGAVRECAEEPEKPVEPEPSDKPEPEPTDKPQPEEPEHPAPSAMWMNAEQAEGGVVLHWEACGTDGFKAYKLVRSTTNQNPTYPLNDGAELIAAIGDANVTTFVDEGVDSGVTYHYRVLSMGNDGSWYALGVTNVVTVTVS